MKKNIIALTVFALVFSAFVAGCNRPAEKSADANAAAPSAAGNESAAAKPAQPSQPATEPAGAPRVVTSVPANGDTQVDPALTEIKVTFDRDMMTEKMWSFATESDETAPKIDADNVKYIDKRTCVAPVTLEPGKKYVIWINSDKFQNFMGEDGVSATPYKIEFETKQ